MNGPNLFQIFAEQMPFCRHFGVFEFPKFPLAPISPPFTPKSLRSPDFALQK
jgi:hypothetical protein